MFLLFWALLLLLSLASFNSNDPSLNHVVSGRVITQNKAGLFGAYAAGFLNDVFGVTALLWPFVFAAIGAAYVAPSYAVRWWRWCGLFLLTICLLVMSAAWDFALGDLWGGGMVGNALYSSAARYLSPVGSGLLWVFLCLVGLQLACNISWFNLIAQGAQHLQKTFPHKENNTAAPVTSNTDVTDSAKDQLTIRTLFAQFSVKRSLQRLLQPQLERLAQWRDKLGNIQPTTDDALPKIYEKDSGEEDNGNDPSAPADSERIPPPADSTSSRESPTVRDDTVSVPARKKAKIPLPGLDLLTQPSAGRNTANENREGRGKALINCLKDFDIQGELVRITPGPVVTMYEVRPAAGTRVNRIANLSDDLSRALKAVAVRIQAPIPGSDTVGIEIPNDNRETVNFRELATSDSFQKSCGPLTMVLGKDIAGKPFVTDLTGMPHLLVAGATGAGKSVCLNSILISLLYKNRPEDMRLLLIDPKRIEMAVYANEPHLVHPVVTEMSDAKNALDWAVREMEQRYKTMGRLLGVRNITDFNKKLASFGNSIPSDLTDLEPLPYLVIVVDELADMMMTAAREVESSLMRLAQLARAAGIHMILATQRPSVDVLTGTIKANFPCRISFQVTSKHDSRTILDQVGAEHLLGRGDMLFKPSGGRLQRLHGPFVSDDEVQNVVTYWKNQISPAYKVDFSEWGSETAGGNGEVGGDAAHDLLYHEVHTFVADQGRASISLIQRRFKIGFNRAARLVEQLERDGIIGPADGSKPRSIVR